MDADYKTPVGISERDHGRRKQNRVRTDMATGQRTPWCRKLGVFVLQLKEDCDVEIDDVVMTCPNEHCNWKESACEEDRRSGGRGERGRCLRVRRLRRQHASTIFDNTANEHALNRRWPVCFSTLVKALCRRQMERRKLSCNWSRSTNNS